MSARSEGFVQSAERPVRRGRRMMQARVLVRNGLRTMQPLLPWVAMLFVSASLGYAMSITLAGNPARQPTGSQVYRLVYRLSYALGPRDGGLQRMG